VLINTLLIGTLWDSKALSLTYADLFLFNVAVGSFVKFEILSSFYLDILNTWWFECDIVDRGMHWNLLFF